MGDWAYILIILLIASILYVIYRWQVAASVCLSKARLDGKTVIVTGANTGIGKEAAKDFAQRGARVILACRDLTRAEAAAQEIREETGVHDGVVIRHLDLASLDSVRKFAKEILESEPQLHILVNNAGLGWIPRTLSKDGYELLLAVNHLGHFLLTHLLLDLLKASAPSRVVTVASLLYKWGRIHFDDLMLEKDYSQLKSYCQSKLANILFSRQLAKHLEGTGVTSYSLHPGMAYSEFGQKMWFVGAFGLQRPAALFQRMFMKSSKQGAQTTIYCAVAEELETVSGKFYDCCKESEPDAHARDDAAAQRLWDISMKLVGLQ